DSLALIDHTYAVAELAQFSIDSYTESYPYNAVWSYLYSWYGQNKYGYIPTISGISQTSMNHGGLLPESNSSSDQKKHFAIVQPNVLLPAEHLNAFLHSQENGSGITPTKKVFGTLKLYEYP
ncbi:hypothetical protein KBD45_08110, partial [Candidatus Dojkabacteria bacterium]|nr:hypothetical protein [Candidatus Dojkabacteria bacterium]